MKTSMKILSVAAVALLATGCAVRPTAGMLYTDVEVPVNATSNSAKNVITGESDKCKSILGLVATGNCSVENAKANSGITNVISVDYKSNNILGIIHTGKTIITGTK